MGTWDDEGNEEPITAQEIKDAFDQAEEDFGEDRSLPFLASIVADRLMIDYGDVIDGLIEGLDYDGKEKVSGN